MNKDMVMAKEIAKKVAEKGGRTFFVGGLVRDKLLNIDNKDIDIEIHNISPSELRNILSSLGEVTEMGASFGILGLKGFDIDIAQPRIEKSNGRGGHKDFEVFVDPFIGFEKAAKRRDFTINALMMDVLTGEVLDFFNGKEDLKNGIIRHVNENTFIEDPLRVLRAAQFAARFDFAVANETIELAKNMDLSSLARERISGELSKALLKANKPSIFFEELRKMNQLDVWFPEVVNLIGVEQNEIYHPEGDVWNHTMLVLNEAAKVRSESSNEFAFMLAALAHDFGKPFATTNENGKIRAIDHEKIGLAYVENFLDRVINTIDIKKYVLNMTELHMKPNMLASQNSSKKKTNKMFDASVNPKDLCLLAKADHFGRGKKDDYPQELFLKERLDWFNYTISQPEVSGKDLINAGIKPGPIFTKMLKESHALLLSNVCKEHALSQVIANHKDEI